MMDAAEEWLFWNDPDYTESRKGWKHIGSDGEYESPSRESAIDVEATVSLEPLAGRSCALCGAIYYSREAKHLYCSERHRETAKKRRQRRPRSQDV